ncbi:MAG: class I SAM-dependent methyltransferase [Bacteroidota bacterium]
MKRFLYYLIPAPFRLFARRLYFLPIDTLDYVRGKRPEGVPPRGKIFIGHGDYVKQGIKFLGYFRELAGLKPDQSVLDVGCGIGRMAVPLTGFLNERGSYDGFDIVKSGIDWCNKHITARHPNFRFHYTGMYNQLYNTSDKTDASSFTFPYADSKFDFVFLTSVFTHMMPAEVEHYIHEISRVMKPGASCLMSFFIVNCESEDLMIKQPTHMNFPVNKGFYRLHSSRVDTANVAYDEEWLLGILESAGLEMNDIKYGQWCGRENFFDYQDLLICSKI